MMQGAVEPRKENLQKRKRRKAECGTIFCAVENPAQQIWVSTSFEADRPGLQVQSARVLTCIFPIALSSSRLCSPPSTCTLNYLTFVTFLHLQGFWAKMSQPWLIGCVFFLVLFCFSFLVFLSFLSFCLSFLAFI